MLKDAVGLCVCLPRRVGNRHRAQKVRDAGEDKQCHNDGRAQLHTRFAARRQQTDARLERGGPRPHVVAI